MRQQKCDCRCTVLEGLWRVLDGGDGHAQVVDGEGRGMRGGRG